MYTIYVSMIRGYLIRIKWSNQVGMHTTHGYRLFYRQKCWWKVRTKTSKRPTWTLQNRFGLEQPRRRFKRPAPIGPQPPRTTRPRHVANIRSRTPLTIVARRPELVPRETLHAPRRSSRTCWPADGDGKYCFSVSYVLSLKRPCPVETCG